MTKYRVSAPDSWPRLASGELRGQQDELLKPIDWLGAGVARPLEPMYRLAFRIRPAKSS